MAAEAFWLMPHELQPAQIVEMPPAPLDAADILTPQQLAARLQVKVSWVFERTRQRSKARGEVPLPFIRMGKYLRFHWPSVTAWLFQQKD